MILSFPQINSPDILASNESTQIFQSAFLLPKIKHVSRYLTIARHLTEKMPLIRKIKIEKTNPTEKNSLEENYTMKERETSK